VHAGAAFSGVQAQASLGVGVVGNFSAAIEAYCAVGFACGDNLDAASAEQRPETDAEGKREGFLWLAIGQFAAGVIATVGRIENDHESGLWSCGCGLGLGGILSNQRAQSAAREQ
jgi:hypothetical protein